MKDVRIETLLALDGTEYTEENGYWYKFEVSLIEPTKERPHGIRYNLTLHDNYNQRILGFDNVHGIKLRKVVGFRDELLSMITFIHQ